LPSKFQNHVAQWADCTRCGLCDYRQRVVLFRGELPCEVLFVGEAPGESEDVIGQPFKGPAGHLFNSIVEQGLTMSGIKPRGIGFTNIVACIPRDDNQEKLSVPPMDAIEACAPRLLQLVEIAKPSLIVWVGEVAEKHGPNSIADYEYQLETAKVIHPAAILRMNISQKGLAIQRAVVAVSEALESLTPF
jgi:uracil-DNA glycosylase family 4